MLDYFIENGVKSAVFWFVGLLCVSIAMGVFGLSITGDFPKVPSSKWQAVFLSNDQVYFGKLRDHNDTYVTLSNVYYLRTAKDLDENQSNLNLIKLGGELHGPEDMIYIPKNSVLFWENMKDTSRVVQTIENSKQ